MRVLGITLVLAACSFPHGKLPDTESMGDAPIGDTIEGDAPKGCPATYTASFGTSRYRTGIANWYQAEMMCEQDGAHLVVTEGDDEHRFVLTLDPDGDIWIGMSDHRVEGAYRWLTGATVSVEDLHWQALQPNNAGGEEDCIEMNEVADVGIWNDNGCQYTQTFVCECDGIALPSPPTWCQTGSISNCNTCGDACDIGELCQSDQVCQ